MEHPLEETIQKILDHGGKLILDKSKSALAKPLDDSKQSWQPHAVIEEPGRQLPVPVEVPFLPDLG